MTLTDLWAWLESLPVAQQIGESAWFPFFESIHVLSAVFVFGSILMVDLRLLNLAARSYSVTRMSRELVPWAWGAFAAAVVTGIALFIPRASAYADNEALQIKFVLLAFAGMNMAIFHFAVYRRVAVSDTSLAPPVAAKVAGAASLFLWGGVMLAGRWIGHLV